VGLPTSVGSGCCPGECPGCAKIIRRLEGHTEVVEERRAPPQGRRRRRGGDGSKSARVEKAGRPPRSSYQVLGSTKTCSRGPFASGEGRATSTTAPPSNRRRWPRCRCRLPRSRRRRSPNPSRSRPTLSWTTAEIAAATFTVQSIHGGSKTPKGRAYRWLFASDDHPDLPQAEAAGSRWQPCTIRPAGTERGGPSSSV
jgi:hypothetical protein